jgi:hypothetical protein
MNGIPQGRLLYNDRSSGQSVRHGYSGSSVVLQQSSETYDTGSSSVLFSFKVDDHMVTVTKRYMPSRKSTLFQGQKMLHPFKTIYEDSKSMYYQDTFASEEIKRLTQDGATEFDVKHDGSCGALFWNGAKGKYEPYARFDIKKKKGMDDFTTELDTSKWFPCEPKPTAERATHWPHFRPVSEDPKMYKWYIKAFENAAKYVSQMTPEVYGELVTIEYMGNKFNGKPCDPLDDKSVNIVLHGRLQLIIPIELRTPEGFRKILERLPVVEGIVVHPLTSSPFKIRAETFKGLEWGGTGVAADFTQQYGHEKGSGLSREVVC